MSECMVPTTALRFVERDKLMTPPVTTRVINKHRSIEL